MKKGHRIINQVIGGYSKNLFGELGKGKNADWSIFKAEREERNLKVERIARVFCCQSSNLL